MNTSAFARMAARSAGVTGDEPGLPSRFRSPITGLLLIVSDTVRLYWPSSRPSKPRRNCTCSASTPSPLTDPLTDSEYDRSDPLESRPAEIVRNFDGVSPSVIEKTDVTSRSIADGRRTLTREQFNIAGTSGDSSDCDAGRWVIRTCALAWVGIRCTMVRITTALRVRFSIC